MKEAVRRWLQHSEVPPYGGDFLGDAHIIWGFRDHAEIHLVAKYNQTLLLCVATPHKVPKLEWFKRAARRYGYRVHVFETTGSAVSDKVWAIFHSTPPEIAKPNDAFAALARDSTYPEHADESDLLRLLDVVAEVHGIANPFKSVASLRQWNKARIKLRR